MHDFLQKCRNRSRSTLDEDDSDVISDFDTSACSREQIAGKECIGKIRPVLIRTVATHARAGVGSASAQRSDD